MDAVTRPPSRSQVSNNGFVASLGRHPVLQSTNIQKVHEYTSTRVHVRLCCPFTQISVPSSSSSFLLRDTNPKIHCPSLPSTIAPPQKKNLTDPDPMKPRKISKTKSTLSVRWHIVLDPLLIDDIGLVPKVSACLGALWAAYQCYRIVLTG